MDAPLDVPRNILVVPLSGVYDRIPSSSCYASCCVAILPTRGLKSWRLALLDLYRPVSIFSTVGLANLRPACIEWLPIDELLLPPGTPPGWTWSCSHPWILLFDLCARALVRVACRSLRLSLAIFSLTIRHEASLTAELFFKSEGVLLLFGLLKFLGESC